ncbi:MAG TPA: rhomboid family intramembrane serine protease [Galbitalea sp.]|jgi:membrane associated rhomboid family serine protease
MSDAARNPDDYCYRHPDRLSFVLCEKCGRTICLECQTHVDGKVLCPDDARRSNVTMLPVNQRPPRVKRVREQPRWLSALTDRVPVVTLTLMALIAVIWLVDLVAGGGLIESRLWVVSRLSGPWTIVTSMISAPAGGDGFLSVVFSLFSLFVIGRFLEPEFGRLRYLAMFALSGLGGSVFALLFGGIVTSASSAIFGMIAIFAVLMRRRGASMIWLYAVIALNIISIALSSARAIIWQGAVGGLVVGIAVGFTILLEGTPEKERRQRLILFVIGIVLVAAAIVRYLV